MAGSAWDGRGLQRVGDQGEGLAWQPTPPNVWLQVFRGKGVEANGKKQALILLA
jgi:hypothetical protein